MGLINKINLYLNNEGRQRIIKDNPIISNMMNDVIKICKEDCVDGFDEDDLELIDECLEACIKICVSTNALVKARNVMNVQYKVKKLMDKEKNR